MPRLALLLAVLLAVLLAKAVEPAISDGSLGTTSTELRALHTSFKCAQEDGSVSDTQVCHFTNLCIANGQLLLLTAGQEEVTVPPITVNWHGQVMATFHRLDTNTVPPELQRMPVTFVDEAVLQHLTWADNYYHSMEAVLAFHMKACEYFGHCGNVTTSGPAPQLIRIEIDGTPGNSDPAHFDWLGSHPAVQQAMNCITDQPSPHIFQEVMRKQVVILKSAVIGIGPSNRIYSGRFARPGFFDVYKTPPQWLTDSFRATMMRCLGAPMSTVQASEKLNVSIINRGDDKGRHFTNEQETRKRIMGEFATDVNVVRLVRPDEMTFPEQIQAYASSSVVITTHSAATANLMFIPQGAAVIEYMWHREVADAHDWIAEVLTDLHLNATFVGVHAIDDRLGEWRRDKFVKQAKYKQLSMREKVAFYENMHLPHGRLDGLDRKFNLNFILDWEVLKPAITRAVREIRSGQHSYYFMEGATVPP